MTTNFSWQLVLREYQHSYYIIALLQALSLLVVLKGILVKRKSRITRIVSIYAAASILQGIFSIITWGIGNPSITMKPTFSLSYFIFLFIEAFCCYALICSANPKPYLDTLLRIVLLGFLIFGGCYLWQVPYQKWNINTVSMVELPLLIFFCGAYYYHLLTQPPQTSLLQQPLFWAISGMAFLAFCLIPFTLVYEYIVTSKGLIYLTYIIPALVYSLVFIIHLKALQCSQKQLEP